MNKIYITIKDSGLRAIPIKSILALESDDHYVNIHYFVGSKVEKTFAYGRIGEITKILPPYFIKIGQSQVINTSKVLQTIESQIEFVGGLKLPMKSKSARKFFYSQLSFIIKQK